LKAGGIDLSFNPGKGDNDNVWTVATQPDGKVVIGGRFTSVTSVNGVARNRIARLHVLPDALSRQTHWHEVRQQFQRGLRRLRHQ
jgi:hypothetical protein